MPPHGKKFANHWHGSYPVQSRGSGRIGRPLSKQYTPERHYMLASIGCHTFVTATGEYFNTPYFTNTQAFTWAAKNKLIKRDMLLGRNRRSWPVERTEEGERMLARWNAEHGEIDIENDQEGDGK